MPWTLDPLEALRRWPEDQPVVMLHSGRLDRQWSRYSLLARPSDMYRFSDDHQGHGRSVYLGDQPHAQSTEWTHEPFTDLRRLLKRKPGLWVGYFSYDLNRFIEPRTRSDQPGLRSKHDRDHDWPLIELRYCPAFCLHDAWTGKWSMHGEVEPEIVHALGARAPHATDHTMAFTHGPIRAVVSQSEHQHAVARAMDYIAAGDIFQVNLAQRYSAEFAGSTRDLYQALAQRSPAWYGAYLELTRTHAQADDDRTIISTSPELFLDLDTAGKVITRPIKGTRPASADPQSLLHSAKDAAELNMIVDLLRNDLGRVCDYGSVRVTQPRTIESHPTVHHGVASITGRLHPTKDAASLLRATFPGGSITGAPKVRAMQIIDQIEPVRRGPYCGSIGFIHSGPDQTTARLNIAIRTILSQTDASGHGRVDYSVGGGIVADSDPATEYQETRDKAAAMEEALSRGELR